MPPPQSAAIAPWPAFDYAAAADADHPAFRVDPASSHIDIVVRREGPLARFGHDHAIRAQAPEGLLLFGESGAASRADLRFAVADLLVDDSAVRARYGLDTEPDEKSIEGTRGNLQQHVLLATDWPYVTIELSDFQCRQERCSALAGITTNGIRTETRQPFRLALDDGQVVAEGDTMIRQTDLGIEPFSALGGGLRVADELEIHFHLRGKQL